MLISGGKSRRDGIYGMSKADVAATWGGGLLLLDVLLANVFGFVFGVSDSEAFDAADTSHNLDNMQRGASGP